MGATSWHYFTPYQPNPEDALRRLRESTFAAGQYQDPVHAPEEHIRQLYERSGSNADSPECRDAVDQVVRIKRALESGHEEDFQALPRGLRASVRRARELANLFGQPIPPSRQQPRTIDELLERTAECGTHSILDITHVAARRGFGAAAPLPPRALQRVFRTTEPTRSQVEERWDDIAERLNCWQAYYFVVYQGGQPHEFAFVGCSGD